MNIQNRHPFSRYNFRSEYSGIAVVGSGSRPPAFTLIEVMIAMAIFFMAVFSILSVVSVGLRNAQALQNQWLDAGPIAADLALTNRVSEGVDSGDFDKYFPGRYQDYTWRSDTYEAATNGLFRVDIVVERRVGNHTVQIPMSMLLYRPESATGSSGSVFRR